MWCSCCQQDVPAFASPEDDRIRCAKCRSEMILRAAETDHAPESPSWNPDLANERDASSATRNESPRDIPPFDFDAWEWDELREANRAVRAWGGKGQDERPPAATQLDAAFQMQQLPHIVTQSPRKQQVRRAPRSRHLAYCSWTTLSLGVMACVFGGVLLTWSFVTDRAELWTLGLPFAIGGQIALVLGLVLQLDGLWQSNHEAAESLSNLDDQLIELRRATSQISSTHSGPSQSFYFHLAEGCSPHMLLADLKGQLDLLALRIADQK
jgi:hypothetical protein